jgi:hypothetical protein
MKTAERGRLLRESKIRENFKYEDKSQDLNQNFL